MKKMLLIPALICALHVAATAQNMMNDVGKDLQSWLEKIPHGQEEQYGFEARTDFAIAALAPAYQVYSLDAAFFSDAALSDKSHLFATGEWRIPVLVRDKYTSMITAVEKEGRWRIVDIGAHVLARELDEYRQFADIKNAQALRILRVYQLQCDFLVTDSPALFSNRISLYPLQSARNNITELRDGQYKKNILSEILPMIKQHLK